MATLITTNLTMDYDSEGPVINLLPLLNGQHSFAGANAALQPFPDGLLAFEHALQTLHSAVPLADTIYISLQHESQISQIQFRLDDPCPLFPSHDHADDDPESPHRIPRLEIISNQAGTGESRNNPLNSLLAAHAIDPDTKWLVLSCEFPLLPPPALQQLVLEYQDPVTCFVKEDGVSEPLIGIWGSEALEHLRAHVGGRENDEDVLRCAVEELQGKLVTPLREEWIVKPETEEEWERAMITWREIRGLR